MLNKDANADLKKRKTGWDTKIDNLLAEEGELESERPMLKAQ